MKTIEQHQHLDPDQQLNLPKVQKNRNLNKSHDQIEYGSEDEEDEESEDNLERENHGKQVIRKNSNDRQGPSAAYRKLNARKASYQTPQRS